MDSRKIRDNNFILCSIFQDPKAVEFSDGAYLFLILRSLEFFIENVVPAFVQWRIVNDGDRYEIAYSSLQILNHFFDFKDHRWENIQNHFCKLLLGPKSTLVAILSIGELILLLLLFNSRGDRNIYLQNNLSCI